LISSNVVLISDASASNGMTDSTMLTSVMWNEYLSSGEYKPRAIIYNSYDYPSKIRIDKHKIDWIKSEEGAKVRIDGKTIVLKGKSTINNIRDSIKDDVDFANDWEELRIYNYNEREIILIKMNFQPCSGTACSVHYFLLYDVTRKCENFFGSFYGNDDIRLYDFQNDDKVDFVAQTFIDRTSENGSITFIYELYSMNKNGRFEAMKNADGSNVRCVNTAFLNDSTGKDSFIQNWIK